MTEYQHLYGALGILPAIRQTHSFDDPERRCSSQTPVSAGLCWSIVSLNFSSQRVHNLTTSRPLIWMAGLLATRNNMYIQWPRYHFRIIKRHCQLSSIFHGRLDHHFYKHFSTGELQQLSNEASGSLIWRMNAQSRGNGTILTLGNRSEKFDLKPSNVL